MLGTIGNTPLVQLKSPHPALRLFGKLEMFNPSGSIKDRVAHYIVEQAERNGLIKPGATLVECSSGNMGTSLAMVGALKGYRVIITVPDKTGPVKRKMIENYGAQVVVCPGKVAADHPDHYTQQARRIAEQTPGAYFINQYQNPWNTDCHAATLGPELYRQTQGAVDVLIACGGSGGTVSGVARYLKSQNPALKVIMPDPYGSLYYDLFYHHKIIPENVYPYQVEGPGNPVCCKTMDLSLIDEVVRFRDEDAFQTRTQLTQEQGIFAGDSSCAAYWVFKQVANRLASEAERPLTVVLILPDSGMKYIGKT